MNFFKSLILDDPDPPQSESPHDSDPDSPTNQSQDDDQDQDDAVVDQDHNTTDASSGGLWSFGGLIQTLATRSETVLETYRRDLEEFGTGLKKETEIFREVASKAVKDLPASIEVAHGAIDGVIKSTAEIISQGKETLLAPSPDDAVSETPETSRSSNSGRYSRFEAQLSAIQNDVNTFCEQPENLDEYNKWKSGFALIEKGEEIANLIGENGVLEPMHKRVVPSVVDNETFWFRYFYRVHKLNQQESVRANLVRRAISIDDEEELSWDVDEDDDDSEDEQMSKGDESNKKEADSEISTEKEDGAGVESQIVVAESAENKSIVESVDKGNAAKDEISSVSSDEKMILKEGSELNSEKKNVKIEESVKEDEKVVKLDGKSDHGGSGKDNVVTVVSSQQSLPEEEDLEWDEIEDIDSNDEKKVTARDGSSNSADVRKRLSAAEDDEDLSWDIEDDDEPVKS